MNKQRTLGIACTSCKFAFHFFTARESTLKTLDGKNFEYCPLCGQKGNTFHSVADVSMWEGAFRWNMPIETYKQLYALYMEYVNNRKTSGLPLSVDKWITQLLKEQLASDSDNA